MSRPASTIDARAYLEQCDPAKLQIWIGLSHGRGLLPRRIKVTTRSKYWHVKIRIGIGASTDLVYEARFLNRDGRHIWTGVRVTRASTHSPDGTDWMRVRRTIPSDAIRLVAVCEADLDAGYDFRSPLRFVPLVRAMIGDRETRADRRRFHCSKFALIKFRAIGIDLIPRMQAFRCAPGHFFYSDRLEDPAPIAVPRLELVSVE
jgi:hypothetical protein